jgi:hypothetical protein
MAKGNDNGGKNKYGDAGYKHRGGYRFNPNPTRCNHAGCQIAIQSRKDKEAYLQQKGPKNK